MTLNVLAPLFCFIGGYGFLYLFALIHPLAQTLAIRKINGVKLPWLWMVHFFYWIFILTGINEIELAITAILCSTILGQILLKLMFGTFGRFNWLLWNSVGLGLLTFTTLWLGSYHIENDFYEIIILVLLFLTSSFLSGIGLRLGYLKNSNFSK